MAPSNYLFWVNEVNAWWQNFTPDTKVQSAVCQWLGRQPVLFSAENYQKLVCRWDKCLDKFGRYIEKCNTDV